MLDKTDTLSIGIVLEKRKSDHPWLDHKWVLVGVIPGAPETDAFQVLRQGDGVTQYLAATLELELHRAEAEAYHFNLTSPEPSLFVVLRENDDLELDVPLIADVITASPYEAQDYLDSSEEIVERILMPENIRIWIDEFVTEHFEVQQFKKRKRDKVKSEDYKFGQEPLAEIRKRVPGSGNGGEGGNVSG